jgi:Phosphotransferase enzyme family
VSRLPWDRVPAWLRHAAEQQLGGRVVAAVTQPGGYSPGAAVRLRIDNGRRAFAKAVGPELNPDSPGLYRAEAQTAAALPASVPAPRLLTVLEADGWVLLLFEDIDGATPAQPWVPAELDRVLAAMAGLAASLTPAPIAAPSAADRFAAPFRGWRQLARGDVGGVRAGGDGGLGGAGAGADGAGANGAGADGGGADGGGADGGGGGVDGGDGRAGADGDLAWLDPWARRHLAGLAELEAGWAAASAGVTPAHGDVRADNILLTADRVLFVDWPWACITTPWFDLAGMLPSVRLGGGPPPEEILAGHPVAAAADPAAITAVVAALAGYFTRQARQPDPPGIPTVRAFQAAQGRVTVDWLKTRTGWP